MSVRKCRRDTVMRIVREKTRNIYVLRVRDTSRVEKEDEKRTVRQKVLRGQDEDGEKEATDKCEIAGLRASTNTQCVP